MTFFNLNVCDCVIVCGVYKLDETFFGGMDILYYSSVSGLYRIGVF